MTNAIQTNVYDNNNKEILASMMRAVLEDFRDSYFNLIDDRLKNFKYNDAMTLEQYLAAIVGALPVYGVIQNIDIGSSSKTTFTTTGVISSCNLVSGSGNETLLEVNFSQSIANRRLIPVLYYRHSEYGKADDTLPPLIRRISSTRIHIAIQEVAGSNQDIDIEVIAL